MSTSAIKSWVRFVGGPYHNTFSPTNLEPIYNVGFVTPELITKWFIYKLQIIRTEYGTAYYEYHIRDWVEPDTVQWISDEASVTLASHFYFDPEWVQKYGRRRVSP